MTGECFRESDAQSAICDYLACRKIFFGARTPSHLCFFEIVGAASDEAAIKVAIKAFEITDKHEQSRIAAMPDS